MARRGDGDIAGQGIEMGRKTFEIKYRKSSKSLKFQQQETISHTHTAHIHTHTSTHIRMYTTIYTLHIHSKRSKLRKQRSETVKEE